MFFSIHISQPFKSLIFYTIHVHPTKNIWALSQENLFSEFPTSWNSNQPAKPQKLAWVLKFWRYQVLFKQLTTKVLIRLHGCAGWSAPLLFAYGINRFSHDMLHLDQAILLKPSNNCERFFGTVNYRVATGQGKVREIWFFFKIREKSGNFANWSGKF